MGNDDMKLAASVQTDTLLGMGDSVCQIVSQALHETMLKARRDRLIIIEWLYAEDKKERAQNLYDQLEQEGVSVDLVEVVICQSASEFEAAIRRATAGTTPDNVPIVHLMTHGAAGDGGYVGGLGGQDSTMASGKGFVRWTELDPLLCNLARASGFQNFVMLTGCNTYDLAAFWNGPTRGPVGSGGHTLIGHYDNVTDNIQARLASATFYRLQFVHRATLLECMACANLLNDVNKSKAYLAIDCLDL